MTDTSLIDVLKAAMDTLASRVYEPSYDEMLPIKCSACGCLGKTPARVAHRPFCILLKLNAHIARLESPELVVKTAETIRRLDGCGEQMVTGGDILFCNDERLIGLKDETGRNRYRPRCGCLEDAKDAIAAVLGGVR